MIFIFLKRNREQTEVWHLSLKRSCRPLLNVVLFRNGIVSSFMPRCSLFVVEIVQHLVFRKCGFRLRNFYVHLPTKWDSLLRTSDIHFVVGKCSLNSTRLSPSRKNQMQNYGQVVEELDF